MSMHEEERRMRKGVEEFTQERLKEAPLEITKW